MKCRNCKADAEINKAQCRHCLDASAAYMRSYYGQPINREKNKIGCMKYHNKNRPERLIKLREYGEKNKAKLSEAARIYRQNNKEMLNERKKIYWQENKEQLRAKKREHYRKNRVAILSKQKDDYMANIEKKRAAGRDDYLRHREKRLETIKAYQKNNLEWYMANRTARNAKRRAIKSNACAAWADKKAINAIYTKAKRMEATTGIVHHVDHIIPLLGKHVCGLHVEYNLQIITAQENLNKSNRYISHGING